MAAKKAGGSWKAKCTTEDHTDLTAEAASQAELEKSLRELAVSKSSGGPVNYSFSYITPTQGVFVISVGIMGGGGGGGAAPAAAAAGGGGGAKEEAKKEEESESDEEMGFSLFD